MNMQTEDLAINTEFRQDFAIIADWVRLGAKVLDLGCGDGSLLHFLRGSLDVRGYGVEKDDANWLQCIEKQLNVIQMDLEDGLSGFEAQSFDVVILSQTLQAMHNTEGIVQEMLRVGREAIVTFPNFGYWRSRSQIAAGRCRSRRSCRTSGTTPPTCTCARSRISTSSASITISTSWSAAC